jgi:hypothetical protein
MGKRVMGLDKGIRRGEDRRERRWEKSERGDRIREDREEEKRNWDEENMEGG